jgi:hypothetical protein
MNHPAELAVHQYLENAKSNGTNMSEDTIDKVCDDIHAALRRQFGRDSQRGKFKPRMSNVGRPVCQLWYDKNKPDTALPRATTFVMNMMIGDIVEAVFKGILTEAGVEYEENEKATVEFDGGFTVNGTADISINGAVDDIKSASNWSYRNKFESYHTLSTLDAFGYVAQLAGYAKGLNKKAGGWWVVNKATGDFKYVPADGLDIEEECGKISSSLKKLKENVFERCFEAEPEFFRGKSTGNKVLNKTCSFCDYRKDCWPSLQQKPMLMSRAISPKIVDYVHIQNEKGGLDA